MKPISYIALIVFLYFVACFLGQTFMARADDESTIINFESSNDFRIAPNGKVIITFTYDGRIIIADGVTPDEAAKEFIRIIKEMWPKVCKK